MQSSCYFHAIHNENCWRNPHFEWHEKVSDTRLSGDHSARGKCTITCYPDLTNPVSVTYGPVPCAVSTSRQITPEFSQFNQCWLNVYDAGPTLNQHWVKLTGKAAVGTANMEIGHARKLWGTAGHHGTGGPGLLSPHVGRAHIDRGGGGCSPPSLRHRTGAFPLCRLPRLGLYH